MVAAIQVENIGKCYQIAQRENAHFGYRTLREALVNLATAPLRRLRGAGGAEYTEPFWALKDVSFEVKPGEVVGLIGCNGAGKSTLLKILSRITKPTMGEVELRGRVGSLLEVGTGFHPELTGRENIYLNGSILGMSRKEIDRQFDEIVAFADVERFLETPVKRYSSGMYLRLAFAVAAHLQPEILIVDEVLAVADAAFQKKCLGKLGAVAESGRTVLFVSHNMAAIASLCRTAYWLDHGRIFRSGFARSVVDEYVSAAVDAGSTVADLDKTRRVDYYGIAARLKRIEWLSGLPLRHGEPVGFHIIIQARSPIEDLNVVVGFSSLEGTRLLSYCSDLGGQRRAADAGETVSIIGQIDRFPLAPGVYAVDCEARSWGTGLDYVGSCAQVEVCPGESSPDWIGLSQLRSSGAYLPAGWQWQQ
jgi:lipopolysaccharide transport system ATP-binding protein